MTDTLSFSPKVKSILNAGVPVVSVTIISSSSSSCELHTSPDDNVPVETSSVVASYQRISPIDGLALGLADGEALMLALGLADGDPLGLADGLPDTDADGLALMLALGLSDGLPDGDADGEALSLVDGLPDSDADGEALSLADGLPDSDADGLVLGDGTSPRSILK